MNGFGRFIGVLVMATAIAGCRDTSAPKDLVPPAAPRGFFTVTGDTRVYLHWLANTESDFAAYRIYEAPCAGGQSCPYDRIASTTGTSFTVEGLANGQTRYFAVAAVDQHGNESALSSETVFDTPRPEGFDQTLTDAAVTPATGGWNFASHSVLAFDNAAVDVYYVRASGVDHMVAPFVDTEIQDAGQAATLDAIDFAPTTGWAPSGAVELVVGHCYVVETHDVHYAKFRVSAIGSGRVVMDWAYQVDPGNRELRSHPVGTGAARARRAVAFAAR